MRNKLVILIAEVKPPSTDVTYLNAHAYMIDGKVETIQNAMEDFRDKLERDGFKIQNALIFTPSITMLLSIGRLAFVFNRVQKPPKPVRCDGGIEN